CCHEPEELEDRPECEPREGVVVAAGHDERPDRAEHDARRPEQPEDEDENLNGDHSRRIPTGGEAPRVLAGLQRGCERDRAHDLTLDRSMSRMEPRDRQPFGCCAFQGEIAMLWA